MPRCPTLLPLVVLVVLVLLVGGFVASLAALPLPAQEETPAAEEVEGEVEGEEEAEEWNVSEPPGEWRTLLTIS